MYAKNAVTSNGNSNKKKQQQQQLQKGKKYSYRVFNRGKKISNINNKTEYESTIETKWWIPSSEIYESNEFAYALYAMRACAYVDVCIHK